ncbi:type VI secretion system baseplate subunit TssF [Rubrimonas cliftonensis]|uniref:Type VI secretion system protein ImpG n=1 Tax=Rubrimonas cliftonensis TaxID=89524 RepID=A0A1H4BHM0_9RHOB|nr:type VI secretion system baseplate subunit TssF [Rubrimonas cliftonensis]SEA47544.1 type VI secretion system protein ImpG [Rubrimonas cliftonensis]
MEEALKEIYESELKHLRTHAEEFAQRDAFHRIASRIGLTPNAALRDPFVEWLLQGYAFLAARVQRKLDEEFPRFSQNLLAMLYPHLSAPTPSMLVAEFQLRADAALMTGPIAPRGMRLSLPTRMAGAARRERKVIFTTGRALRLWPLMVTAARYLPDSGHVESAGASRAAPAAVSITFALTPDGATLGALPAEALDLHCAEGEGGGAALFEALTAGCAHVEAAGAPRRPGGGPGKGPKATALEAAPLGFDRHTAEGEDALLPYGPRSFDGHRLLHEFFALPARFHFLRLGGLQQAFGAREQAREFTVLFLLDRPFPALGGKLGPESVRLNCAPAVNLFERAADDIAYDPRRAELPITPDRGDPTSFEVHSVLNVTGKTGRGETVAFRPFFAPESFGARSPRSQRFYALHRVARAAPALREERDRSLEIYRGAEVFISLVDEAARPAPADLRSLSLDLLCTNRHLAINAASETSRDALLSTEIDEGWKSVRVVSGPSWPRAGLPEGRRLWDVISALTLNHLSLCSTERGDPAAAMRQTLRLFAAQRDAAGEALIEALVDISTRPAIGPIAPIRDEQGRVIAPMAMGRGLDVAVTFADAAPEAATLAAVLERFLPGHANVNSFTRMSLRQGDGRARARWPARSGTRPLL